MIFTLALAHIIHTTQPNILHISPNYTIFAKTRSSFSRPSSSSFSRSSFLRPSSSSFSHTAPTRIKINSSGVTRVQAPKSSGPINITKPANSSLKPNILGPKLTKTTFNKIQNSDGSISITKSLPKTTAPVLKSKSTIPPVAIPKPKSLTSQDIKPSKPYFPQRRFAYSPNYYPQERVYVQDNSFSNPWMWMYLMDRNDNRPQVIQTAPQSNLEKPANVKTIVKEEGNPVKDFLLIVLGLICGLPLGYLFFKNRTI